MVQILRKNVTEKTDMSTTSNLAPMDTISQDKENDAPGRLGIVFQSTLETRDTALQSEATGDEDLTNHVSGLQLYLTVAGLCISVLLVALVRLSSCF